MHAKRPKSLRVTCNMHLTIGDPTCMLYMHVTVSNQHVTCMLHDQYFT